MQAHDLAFYMHKRNGKDLNAALLNTLKALLLFKNDEYHLVLTQYLLSLVHWNFVQHPVWKLFVWDCRLFCEERCEASLSTLARYALTDPQRFNLEHVNETLFLTSFGTDMFRQNMDAYQGNSFHFLKKDGPEVVKTRRWLDQLLDMLPRSTLERPLVKMYDTKQIDTWTSGRVALRTGLPWQSHMSIEDASMERWRDNIRRTRTLTATSWLHGVSAAVDSGRVGALAVEQPPFVDVGGDDTLREEMKEEEPGVLGGVDEEVDDALGDDDATSDDDGDEAEAGSLDWKYGDVDPRGGDSSTDASSVYRGPDGPVPAADRPLRQRRQLDWRQRFDSDLELPSEASSASRSSTQ